MDRRFQQAIDEDFERLVRESPRPMLLNGELAGNSDVFEKQDQLRLVRPVPIALVRNRAAPAFVSPLAKTLVSPHPQINNTANDHEVSSVNESIEEIFGYLKQKSFDSSVENLEKNSSDVIGTDQSRSLNFSKNTSTGNVYENYDDDIETIDCPFVSHSAVPVHQPAFTHRTNGENAVNNTVYNNYDEVDGYDTGYCTANLKDLSMSGDEQALNDRVSNNKPNTRSDFQKEFQNDRIERLQSNFAAKQKGHLNENGAVGDISDTEDDLDQLLPAAHKTNEMLNSKQAGYSYEIECREIEEDGEQSSVVESDVEQELGREPSGPELGREPCSLFMWIIKPIPATQFICVEGKKHPDEDVFWKSGIITKRLNAKTVRTQSGNVYKLEGDIEVADAVYAGFSRETVAAFKSGFPENWEELIDDHFNSHLQDRPSLHGVSDTDISTTVENEPAVPVTKSSGPDKEKEYVLSKWWLKPVGKDICVIGSNPDGLLWHSSAIEERLTNRKLITSNGSVCRLKGHMDRLQAKEENTPDVVIKKFHTGFPKEWQELIQEHYTQERSAVEELRNQSSQTRKKEKKAEKITEVQQKSNRTLRKKQPSSQDKVKPQAKRVTSVSKASQKSQTPSKLGNDSVSTNTSMISEGQLDKTVLTPRGQVVSLDNLNRSRTGRILKPCVYWWAGQRVSVTEEGVVIKGTTEYGNKYLKTLEEDYKNKSKVFGRYRFSKLHDTSISSVSSLSSIKSNLSNKSLIKEKNENNKVVVTSKPNDSSKVTRKINSLVKESNVKNAVSETKKESVKSQIKNSSVKESKVKNAVETKKETGKNQMKNASVKESKAKNAVSETKKESVKKQIKNASVKESKVKSAVSESKRKTVKKQIKSALKNSPNKVVDSESETEGDKGTSKASDPELEKLASSESKKYHNQSSKERSKKQVKNALNKSTNHVVNSEPKKHYQQQSSKVKQSKATSKDSDPKLDEEVFVVLNDAKEKFLRSKSPNRTTCYNSGVGKTRREKNILNGSKDVYTLDESSDSDKVNTNKVIEKDPKQTNAREKNRQKKTLDKTTPGSETDRVLKKKKNLEEKQSNETNRVLKNKEENGLRELVNLQCDMVKDINSDNSSVPLSSNRVTRSKNRVAAKVNYSSYFQLDSSRPRKRIKLSTIEEADDSINKSQTIKENTKKAKQTSGKKESKKSLDSENQEEEREVRKEKEDEKAVLSNDKKIPTEKKSKSQQSKAGKQKQVALTAGTGTLKRKLQLKEVLEQQNENYEDNLFDSTPFRHTRKRKRAVLDDIDDNALFEELARKQGKNKFVTPAAGDVKSRIGRAVPLASARKTPACYSKEDLLGSSVKNLDGYVHNLKKRQLLHARRRRKNHTPKSVKKSVHKDDSPQKKLFDEFLHGKKDILENHKDSDCEEDYYWDEEMA